MPDPATSPAPAAEGASAAAFEQSAISPQAPVAPAATETAPKPASEAAPTPTAEPDYDSLFSKPEAIEKLLQNERVKKEIEHRARSARQTDVQRQVQETLAQERQHLEAETTKRLQAEREKQTEAEYARLIEEDPTSPLAQRVKVQLEERAKVRLVEQERQRLLESLGPQLEQEYGRRAGEWWLTMLATQVQGDTRLTPEDKQALDPRDRGAFPTPEAFFAERDKRLITNEAKRLAKELAKVEAEALVQERLGQARDKAESPANLPEAKPGLTPKDFFAEYQGGNNNDHKRALQYLKEMGLPL